MSVWVEVVAAKFEVLSCNRLDRSHVKRFPFRGLSQGFADYEAVVVTQILEKRVAWRIFESKGEEVAGVLRKLHSEVLHILYSSQNLISRFKPGKMK
jgi:hypothetical protein